MDLQEIIKKTNHIPSSVTELEQALWLKYLKDLPEEVNIVDFGTGWGKSAASLALACPQGFVYTFDIGEEYVKNRNVQTLEEYEEKVNSYIQDILNLTFTVDNSLAIPLPLFKIDVLNYDSQWTDKEYAMRELERWVPLIKDNGLLFVHDYEHWKFPEVQQAIKELETELKLKLLEAVNCGQYTVGVFQVCQKSPL